MEDKLLTAGGHRDSCAQENALQPPGVTQAAIDKLVERRLIRREEHCGVARLELAHDRLAAPIQLNRERRHEAEGVERERAAVRAAQERERKAVADLRAARRQRAILTAISATAIALTRVAVFSTLSARSMYRSLLEAVIWTDSKTGLTWTRTDSGFDVDQAAATRYCQNLRPGGWSDWRLPSVFELLAVTKSEAESKRHYTFRSGAVSSQSLASDPDRSENWLQSPDRHWTVKSEYSIGLRALCVRGTPLPGASDFTQRGSGTLQMICCPLMP